jgi:cation diffusion facilitator CzcD-associated flavoprotein CzcO
MGALLLFTVAIAILLLLLLIIYIIICRYNFRKLCQAPITNPITNHQTKLSQQIVIIGAGVSGIAAAKTFLQYGYTNITILEASYEIGGVWRSSQYVGASIQGPYWLYQYADFPWPKDLINEANDNVSPDKATVQKYIQRYAERYGLLDKVDIRYGCYVKKITRDATRGIWIVSMDNKNRGEDGETMEADVLLMCIGNNSSSPIIPNNIPGRELYHGTVLHSSEVGDGSILNENAASTSTRNICIIGGSKSAYDIGQIHPNQTTIIMRTPHYWTPRWIVCLPFFDRLVGYMFRGYRVHTTDRSYLVRFLDWSMATTIALGIHKPTKHSMLDDIMNGGGLHICTTHSEYINAKNKWKVETSQPVSYTENGLKLENGKEIEADVIVWGTGFAPTRFFEEVFESITLQNNLDDGLYLHKYVAHPSLPNCYFIGFRDPSLNVPTVASVQSLWAAMCVGGVVNLPSANEMRDILANRMQNTRHNFPYSHRRAYYDYFLQPPYNDDYSYALDLICDCKLENRVASSSSSSWCCNPMDIWTSSSAFRAVLGAQVVVEQDDDVRLSDSTRLL